MDIDDQQHPRHTLVQHWVSVGDVMVLIASVVTTVAGVAFVYGGLSREVSELRREIENIEAGMSPPAAQAIAAIRAVDEGLRQDIDRQRDDSIEFRREVRESLARIEAKLDDHDKGR